MLYLIHRCVWKTSWTSEFWNRYGQEWCGVEIIIHIYIIMYIIIPREYLHLTPPCPPFLLFLPLQCMAVIGKSFEGTWCIRGFTVFNLFQNLGSAGGFYYALILPMHGSNGTLGQVQKERGRQRGHTCTLHTHTHAHTHTHTQKDHIHTKSGVLHVRVNLVELTNIP